MSTSKRLAIVIPDMGGGGAERVALRLVNDWLDAGHEVDLVLMRAAGELLPLVPPQVTIVDLGARRIRSALLPLSRYLRTRRPDAVHVAMWPLTVIGTLAHRNARSPARLVLVEHTSLASHYAHFGPLRLQLLRRTIAWAYPFADVRVAVSDRAADDLARVSGIERASIEVIYNPVANAPAHAPDPLAEQYWGSSQTRILTVGRFSHEKNHALLIRAFAAVKRRRPDARLIIVGDGPLRAKLEQIAAREGVAEDVVMPGFILDPWPYYASANLFVLSSNHEGFPLVLIEAMRSGLAVVSTDCDSGPREILVDGAYGPLVPCGDPDALAAAMETALQSPVDADRLKARAEQLSGAETSRRHLQLMVGDDQSSRDA